MLFTNFYLENTVENSHEAADIYTVYHISTSQPDHLRIIEISAADMETAQRLAEQRLVGCSILRIVRNTECSDDADLPGARFINGRFHPSLFAEDAQVSE